MILIAVRISKRNINLFCTCSTENVVGQLLILLISNWKLFIWLLFSYALILHIEPLDDSMMVLHAFHLPFKDIYAKYCSLHLRKHRHRELKLNFAWLLINKLSFVEDPFWLWELLLHYIIVLLNAFHQVFNIFFHHKCMCLIWVS